MKTDEELIGQAVNELREKHFPAPISIATAMQVLGQKFAERLMPEGALRRVMSRYAAA